MPKVLVYVRPWNVEQFLDLAHGVWPGNETIQVSEHRRLDNTGLHKTFVARYKSRGSISVPDHLSAVEIEDVIRRCRLLRNLPRTQAERLVASMAQAIDTVFDRNRFEAMLSITTDSYVLHLFVLACRQRSVPFIGLVPSFLNGYFRITALGEYTPVRDVSEDEVEMIRQALLDITYKPDFVPPDAVEMQNRARRFWLRNTVKPLWFALKRRLSGDPLNYHDWSTEIIARRAWSPVFQTYHGVYPAGKEDLVRRSKGRRLIFLPLQMSPEATIDYWSEDLRWIEYEDRILELIADHRDACMFIAKEHPNVLGNRSREFYSRLAAEENCVMVSPEVPSNILLGLCDAVAICTGTVGFEAALRGLAVHTDSNPFHLPTGVARPLADLSSTILTPVPKEDDQLRLIRHVLACVLPGLFVNNGSWQRREHDQSSMVNGLRRYLFRIQP